MLFIFYFNIFLKKKKKKKENFYLYPKLFNIHNNYKYDIN